MKKLISIILMLCMLVAAVSATTVTRSFSQASVGKNSAATVTLQVDVTGGDTYYLIDEEFPTGLAVTSASDSGDFTTKVGHIFWVVTSGAVTKTYTYTINSGSIDGNYNFVGTYGSESNAETSINGPAVLTVGSGGAEIGDTIPATGDNGMMMLIIVGAVIVGAIFLFKKK